MWFALIILIVAFIASYELPKAHFPLRGPPLLKLKKSYVGGFSDSRLHTFIDYFQDSPSC